MPRQMQIQRYADRFRLLVFDWDGTLMDSQGRIVACLARALEETGLPPLPPERLSNVIGLGLPEAARQLLPHVHERVVERFIAAYRRHYLSDKGEATPLFPGARETLQTLREAGFLLAVATGKSRRGLARSLEETGCGDLFLASRCADECFSKPHPQMLQDIMTDLDTPPEQTLMIGDTEYDLLMAANAGTASVAVSYGVHERERLLSHAPLACLDAIEEIVPWLGLDEGPEEADRATGFRDAGREA